MAKSHRDVGLFGAGHDFDHALRVGIMAKELLRQTREGQLAGIAGLCHNADRILQCELSLGHQAPYEIYVERLVREWLMYARLEPEEERVVVDAVLCHSEPNSDADNLVTIALKDADRLVNMEPDIVMRSAQYHSTIPAVDPVLLLEDEKATFHNPGSVLKDLYHLLEWADETKPKFCVRLTASLKIAKARARWLQDYIDAVLKARKDNDLVPYPFAEEIYR